MKTYPRDLLKVDTIYYVQPDDQYFFTPDGVGAIWYDTLQEIRRDTGIVGPVITLHIPLED